MLDKSYSINVSREISFFIIIKKRKIIPPFMKNKNTAFPQIADVLTSLLTVPKLKIVVNI